MGTDIKTWAVDKDGNDITNQGNWGETYGWQHTHPFDWRSYAMFGWLADVRNYSEFKPIAKLRDLSEAPKWLSNDENGDWWDCSYGNSWVSVSELVSYDYDAPVEDRRVTRRLPSGVLSGGCTCDEGGGEMTTMREVLGKEFFDNVEELVRIGADRVYFCFDC